MDALIGGVAVALGLAFIGLDAVFYRRLDLLAWVVVLAGGVIIALFGLAFFAGSVSRGRGRATARSARTDGGPGGPDVP